MWVSRLSSLALFIVEYALFQKLYTLFSNTRTLISIYLKIIVCILSLHIYIIIYFFLYVCAFVYACVCTCACMCVEFCQSVLLCIDIGDCSLSDISTWILSEIIYSARIEEEIFSGKNIKDNEYRLVKAPGSNWYSCKSQRFFAFIFPWLPP